MTNAIGISNYRRPHPQNDRVILLLPFSDDHCASKRHHACHCCTTQKQEPAIKSKKQAPPAAAAVEWSKGSAKRSRRRIGFLWASSGAAATLLGVFLFFLLLRNERGGGRAVDSGDDYDYDGVAPYSEARRLKQKAAKKAQYPATASGSGMKLLYIVTTLSEYNSGTRNTVKGSDRLQETLIPVLSEGVTSMVEAGFDVDVFLVCHFQLQPERQQLVKAALPESVGLDVWNDATPLGYDTSKAPDFEKLENRTLHLARQHRFVIKDKLLQYDMFVNFEDDMVIKSDHVLHFLDVTNELKRLEDAAPGRLPPPSHKQQQQQQHKPEEQYHGVMTKGMLQRMIPGFIRVEVLLDEQEYGAQTDTGPIPVDLDFTTTKEETKRKSHTVNAATCCHVSKHLVSPNRPAGTPAAGQLMLWETHVKALGVRQMPESSWLDWVVLQRGPNQSKLDPNREVIGDYWSNRHGDYYPDLNRRPAPQEFKYINNQGGWMATQQQLVRWHTAQCPGGFLPPYEAPHYQYDGLDMRNVEWYSGGMQLSTVRHACNLQRIVLLEPRHFSKSLLYHSANNKQRQLHGKREEMFTKAETLLGQLNAIRKRAMRDMKEETATTTTK